MPQDLRRYAPWLLAWLAATVLGSLLIGRLALERQREAFETDARIAHRLLSQRVVQHDAVLATLALLQPGEAGRPEQRLPSVYPQVLGVQRHSGADPWPDEQLEAARVLSRALKRATVAQLDLLRGRYSLVLAADPTSYALQLDLRAAVPWAEWPMAADTSPVRVTLEHASQTFTVQPGRVQDGGWRFDFHKHLAADSQPFDVVVVRSVGWTELPWSLMLGWALAAGALLAAGAGWLRQREQRQRAEELLRLGQVSRLNALGELAAGMAHELNQPLTALLASAQAAARLLDEEPPELPLARGGVRQAVEQARRASEVVGRLRRAVERPDPAAQPQPLALSEAARNVLYLLEPELARHGVAAQLHTPDAPVRVLAEPVALEQIAHNLVVNALQAMERVPAGERRLDITVSTGEGRGVLAVADSGPGIAAEALPRIFEPFFTTRDGGLGLGLSLCESLAAGMDGRLAAAANTPRGAVFRLSLPLAGQEAAK